jgi:hypothetical protein
MHWPWCLVCCADYCGPDANFDVDKHCHRYIVQHANNDGDIIVNR